MGLLIKNINMSGSFRGTFPQVPPGPTPPPPPPPPPSDQYANYTVLQLPGTGTNNTNNNVFLDSSSNNFTVTRFGNTTQGSFSPFSTGAGYWSNYFDGTGDFLTLADNAAFDFGTGNFTIECWIFTSTSSVTGGMVLVDTRTTSSPGFVLHTTAATNRIQFTNLNSQVLQSTDAFTLNTWNHIALVRSGTTIRIYVNGVSSNSATSYTSAVDSTTFRIGSKSWTLSGVGEFNGYISNLRVVKGTAVYTSNFTPSTAPLTAISGTSLLTCQSSRIRDVSTNNFAITVSGTTAANSFSPFSSAISYNSSTMGGNMYFDGNGDYLSVPDNDALEFGTDNFTVEFWLYLTADTTCTIIGKGGLNMGGGDVQGWSINYNNSTKAVTAMIRGTVAVSTNVTFGNPGLNNWVHIALTRNSGTLYGYRNGVNIGTLANTNNPDNTRPIIVGADFNASYNMSGYISNLRIVKGTAVYTSNFTPPTAPVTAISGTSLLLNGTNAAIVDQSGDVNLETLGDAKVSTTVSANGSMFFDGSGDYVIIPASPNLSITSGRFTIEAWIYPTNVTGEKQIIAQDDGINSSQVFQFRLDSSTAKLNFIYFTTASRSNSVSTLSNNAVALNTWSHVAVSYTGSVLRLFINGVQENSVNVASMFSNTIRTAIGSYTGGSPTNFVGYMNDVRITKGIARYTSNFTPPTRS